jgi:hypothetical protein
LLCCLQGLETGQRSRIDSRPMSLLEARDLPHCTLSRALEERLAVALAQERAERARLQVRGGVGGEGNTETCC